MNDTIGFIGLGAMGLPIAENLITSGHQLAVFNRTRAKAEELSRRGALAAARPAEAAHVNGICFTMVADDRALEEVTLGDHGIARALGAGGVHIAMSTVAPATSRKLAEAHRQAAGMYVAAPVFGRPDAARARRLWICLSGPSQAKERAKPLLEKLSQGIFDFGEDPGAANVVKLAGNFMIAAAMEAMAEAFTLADKSGLDAAQVGEMLTQTLFACPAYRNYAAMIAAKRHAPAGFRLPLGLKDVQLVLSHAAEVKVPMPAAGMVRDRLLSAVAKGRSGLDWSALALGAREDAGVKLPEA
jgi:3-hydroxyisobutyrate dehydrogenase-like beta-hydroxyacid dehydrogenase